jgi:hypothetical protein
MDMETALRTRLIEDPAVAALTAARVSWLERPQGEGFPAITLQMIDDPREQHLRGLESLQTALVQLDVWALTYASANAVKGAAIAALLPAATVGSVRFQRSFVRSRDLSERTDTKLIFRPSLDFTINYSMG